MENEFKNYARNLDLEIKNLPTLKRFLDIEKELKDPRACFNGFITNLKGILDVLGASNIKEFY